MNARSPLTVSLTVIAYVVATFGVHGMSHFAINAGHYADIPIIAPSRVELGPASHVGLKPPAAHLLQRA